jgi:UDP:flavonoid glycosyltransferase YjiC (YdhE family)
MPWLSRAHALGPRAYGAILSLLKRIAGRIGVPINEFRAAQGLGPVTAPLFDDKHSPELVLAMFSPLIGEARPDWPSQTIVTGYAFYDGNEPQLDAEVEEFLDAGPPPIVFTLGSAAVFDPGAFFDESVKAAMNLRRRALLLVGPQPGDVPLTNETVGVFGYAPFSKLFPRCAAIVHQGGSGTTGQAMRAGRPMLIVPYAHDQPDNALRAAKLGISATVRRERYNAGTATRALAPLLTSRRVAARAEEIGDAVAHEDGAAVAADAIEQTFGGSRRGASHGSRITGSC